MYKNNINVFVSHFFLLQFDVNFVLQMRLFYAQLLVCPNFAKTPETFLKSSY